MCKVQVLVATMNQNDYSLLSKMNIQSDAIFGNQCSRCSIEKFMWGGNEIQYFNFPEKGVGLNRNNALLRATDEYCLFADDDMIYYDNYPQTVSSLFEKYPKADVLIFNIDEPGKTNRRHNTKVKKVNSFNYFNYGCARIAIRRERISMNAIFFNTNFGGGTQYSAGEDVLFIRDCLRKKMRIMTVPYSIARLSDERDSSWFKGYTEKYFFDKGVFFGIAHPKLAKLFAFYLTFRHKEYTKGNNFSRIKIYKLMKKGIEHIGKQHGKK